MGHLGWLFVLLAPLTCCHNLGHPPCKKDEFSCHNRLCIAPHLRCDGVNDCGDGSDEASCQNCTAPDSFSCGLSDVCLPKSRLCDGRSDCKDGRDESRQLCGSSRLRPQTSPTCTTSEFQCRDGQCIRHIWRCDHSADCSDGSDEVDCDQNECEVNNGGCSHHCVDQLMGFYCDCPDNMKLVGDSHCEEVDLCLESDVCDQLCVHMNGSLTCDCHSNYQMNEATRECEAKGHQAQLVFTSSKGIQSISITGTEYRKLAPHSSGPGPVAALVSNRTLYWAGPERGSIYRTPMGGKPEDSVLVLKVQGSVSGLAVDWIHQILYWTSTEGGSVNVGLLDGSAQRPLITGLEKPSAVAVEPVRGLLFWAQRGSSPKIERSRLDGRDRTALVTSLLRHPAALSLDVPRQLLYWVDQGMRTISRVTLEGRHRKTVVESNGYLDRPFGLAVFECVNTYSVRRKTNRCPLILFFNIIDVSAFNAFVLWTAIQHGAGESSSAAGCSCRSWDRRLSHPSNKSPPAVRAIATSCASSSTAAPHAKATAIRSRCILCKKKEEGNNPVWQVWGVHLQGAHHLPL